MLTIRSRAPTNARGALKIRDSRPLPDAGNEVVDLEDQIDLLRLVPIVALHLQVTRLSEWEESF